MAIDRGMNANAIFLVGIGVLVSHAACSSESATATRDGRVTAAAAGGGVGDPCAPQQENDAKFLGFDEKEVTLETLSPSCATGICLVNHFRGRTSCPYGQDGDGAAPSGAAPCKTPSSHASVTGFPGDVKRAARVPAQCTDRTTEKAVYCSCRCANAKGRTDDGATYCPCGAGLACTPLVASIRAGTDELAGSYCVKSNTAYDAATACNASDCDPVTNKCN